MSAVGDATELRRRKAQREEEAEREQRRLEREKQRQVGGEDDNTFQTEKVKLK